MSNRKSKLRLFDADPHCHWCGRLTVLTEGCVQGSECPEMATVDHLYSKFNPRRWVRNPGNTKVLACYECNQKRADLEQSLIPREELVKRGLGIKFNRNLFNHTYETIEEVMNKLSSKGLDTLTWIPLESVAPLMRESLTKSEREI